jgi:hypothetical protein
MKITLINIVILGAAALVIYFFVAGIRGESGNKDFYHPTHAELARYDNSVLSATQRDLQYYFNANQRHAKAYAAFTSRLIAREQAFYRTHGIYTVHLLADLSLENSNTFDDTREVKDISTKGDRLIIALSPGYGNEEGSGMDYGCQRMNFDANRGRCEHLIYKFLDSAPTLKLHTLTLNRGKTFSS